MSFKDEYATHAETAQELNISVRTLARWRAERIGPAYTKIGARVYYRRAAITEWVRKHETAPVREAA
ncbi:MAG: DNA-binding protein [Alphaproteobacteria bacterium]|jgi:hypothetical protein|nr:DNA-binding protein [Alphaproteobacteria bacterium]